MKQIHIIMPMAGEGKRFKDAGYATPKPLIKVEDKELYRHAQDSLSDLFNTNIKRTFIIRKEHIDNYEIDKNILTYYPNSNIIIIDKTTNGSLETLMLAEKYICDDDIVISLDCDIRFVCDRFIFNIFNKLNGDDILPLVLSFYSKSPLYSYIVPSTTNKNYGMLLIEKHPVSNYAIGGCYVFGNGKIFKEASHKMIDDFYNGHLNDKELYISSVFNYIMELNNCLTEIVDMNLHEDRYWSFGTPEELQNYKYENNIWDK